MTKHLRPVLGISCCNRTIGEETAQAVMNRYVMSALPYADAAGLLVPATPDLFEAREIAPRLDGLLLTGSPSNLGVDRYDPDAHDAAGPFDAARDEMTKRLIDAMLEIGKPVFGICRGFQEINVAFGGTLRRDMAEHPDLMTHHAIGDIGLAELFEHEHDVTLTRGGVLASAYGKENLKIISVHYQGADKLGTGLSVEARAPDGVVEAVSARVNGATVLAVQWHPEWRAAEKPESQTFFELMGRALRGDQLGMAPKGSMA
jgi:putative glutamine amidotransferase